jgi:hypothetical protein
MEKIKDYFFNRLKRDGVLTSYQDLIAYAKRKKIHLPEPKKKTLRKLRRDHKYLAIHYPHRKNKVFASLAFPNVGVLQIDLGL